MFRQCRRDTMYSQYGKSTESIKKRGQNSISIKICRKIDKLGRIVIPIDLRKQYGFKPGDEIWFTAYDNGILIHSESIVYNAEKDNEK